MDYSAFFSPNPASENILVKKEALISSEYFRITNSSGSQIYHFPTRDRWGSQVEKIDVDISLLPVGMYIGQIMYTDGKSIAQKLLIHR
ncbi:MAG: T9SS type A sorting domain-containing protein [Saprospiraceae bacterium]|nr:T9SS type A sorting domain-containing protein [Saprospiraceae bacterium]